MFRLSLMSIFLFSFLAGALVVSAQQDYVDQLIQLTELTANQQYREAINRYKKLESQPGNNGSSQWIVAGSSTRIRLVRRERLPNRGKRRSAGVLSFR